MNFTKGEFVEQLAKATGGTKKSAGEILDVVTDIVLSEVQNGKAVCFGKLGKFKIVTRSARKSRNPQTGAIIQVPSKDVLTFKRSSVL